MIINGRHNIPRYITGGATMVLALYLIHHQRADVIALSACSFLFLICASDTICSKIPNLFNLCLLLFSFSYHYHQAGLVGAKSAFLGLLTGIALFLIPFLMGGMGAGDVKALAALGALLGPQAIFQVFIYTILWGGLMGLSQYFFVPHLRKNLLDRVQALLSGFFPVNSAVKSPHKTLRFPFAAAIALGYFSFISFGSVLELFNI